MNLRNRINKKVLLIFIGDSMIFYAALYTALAIRYGSDLTSGIATRHVTSFGVIFILWLITFGASGFYDLRSMKNEKVFLYRLLRVMAINTVAAITLFYLFPFEIEPRRNLFIITSFATIGIFIWRYFFNLLIIRTAVMRVIFMGFNTEMVTLAGFLLRHPQLGNKPVAFIISDIHPRSSATRMNVSPGDKRSRTEEITPTVSSDFRTRIPSGIPRKPSLRASVISNHEQPLILPADIGHIPLNHPQLSRAIRDTKPDMIVISPEMKGNKMTVNVLLSLIPLGIGVAEFPAFHEAMTGKIPLSLIEEVWFLENLIGIKKRSYEFLKRLIDVACSVPVGIAACIMLPFIVLAIKLETHGPIFFRQTRVGRHGKLFTLIKFRSMVNHAEHLSGFKTHGQQDPRQTRVGTLMRKTYLDELPQVINIFRGEMSFIGPRPERPEYVRELKQKIPFYETRFLVPPGITGWAQVNMENDASVEDAPEKLQYDLYYIKNRTLILDLLISLRTLSAIARRQGR